MTQEKIHTILTWFIAAVWIANGLFCKLLNMVPRHEQIVARILGEPHAAFITKAIGVSEILIATWILSRFMPRLNAATQIGIVATMNIIEFMLAPDLLLWGKANLLFAILFMLLVYYNGFIANKKQAI